MSISRIKQIKRILKEHDVRDPRGALQAIEQVVAQKNIDPRKPVAVIKVFDQPEGKGQLKSQVEIEYSKRRLEPRHLKGAIIATQACGDDIWGGPDEAQCDDPNCPVHGTGATDLGELFKKFEEAALNKNKGNLQ